MVASKQLVSLLAAALLAGSPCALSAQDTRTPIAEAVSIARPPGTIAGTLLVPHGDGPVPVVLLIAGSGPTDRDGNGPTTKPGSLQQLAESLATRRIATLRFDKRGVAGSSSAGIPDAELRFDTLAADVVAWMRFLGSDRRFSRVIVAGHSEGALLGLIALSEAPAAGYISLDGAARPIDEVIHDQLAARLPPPLLAESDTILARLERGLTTDSIPTVLAGLFRPTVQQYLISEEKYSGAGELGKLKVPCLIVQGSHDLQVLPAEAAILERANARCRVAMIDGMNHVLKQAPADMAGQLPSYHTPDAPLATRLIDAIATFVNDNSRR